MTLRKSQKLSFRPLDPTIEDKEENQSEASFNPPHREYDSQINYIARNKQNITR